jgi:tRNA threonylcarbamoyladenosine biosynthesis protein TsaE
LTERTTGPDETEALGARLATGLRPGDVVFVAGELGSGKTTLVRGACRALGVTQPVTSPTFTIGQRYEGTAGLISHLDLYRLADLGDEEPGLLDDYLTADAISFIEWPALVDREFTPPALGEIRVALRVELRHAGGDEREIVVEEGQ